MPRSAVRSVLDFFLLHQPFSLEVFLVASHCRDRDGLPAANISHRAILIGDFAFDLDFVPALGVTCVANSNVVVVAPEKGHAVETLSVAQDVSRGGLPLTLGDDPVLDTDFLACLCVRPTRDVTCSEN